MAEEASSPIVELANATIARVKDPLSVRLRGVNWRIQPGEFWALGAPSDSGKSDVLLTAAGLQRPVEGNCLLHGRDLATLGEADLVEARRKVGFVFEGGGRLFPHLSIRENIELPICYHSDCDSKAAREWASLLIDAVHLKDHADTSPGRLGRAVHQRAALARALALEPEALFLDDPVSGLDPRQARWWLEFLGQLASGNAATKGRKLTIILGTSDLRNFTPLSTHIALIRRGLWNPGGPKASIAPTLLDDDSFFDDETAPAAP